MVGNDSQSLEANGFGVGIGITSSGGQARNIHTALYDNSADFTKVNEATPTFNGPAGSDVFLLAMKVNWNESGTPDEIFVFIIDDLTTEPDESDALATDTFDFDLATQQSLDVFNFSDTQVGYVDEIRVATTFAEAVGGEAPSDTKIKLAITPNGANFDFTWESRDGKLYDLVSSTELSIPPADWPVYEGNADIAGTAPENTLPVVPPTGPKRFFAVIEKDPPPLLAEDFESVTGPGAPAGWSATDNGAGTAWEVGAPSGAATGPDAAASGTQCAGTNIGANYTASAEASLVTRPFTVPATGATLKFRQYIDSEATPSDDLGSIRLLNAGDDTVLAGGDVATGLEGILETWTNESIPLPAVANGLSVKLEFRFVSDADAEAFAGFYIDDVEVIADAP
jgi:hypothetical protein